MQLQTECFLISVANEWKFVQKAKGKNAVVSPSWCFPRQSVAVQWLSVPVRGSVLGPETACFEFPQPLQ